MLFINDVIKEDEVLDAKTLPMVKMPIGNNYASLPDWKPRTPRLKMKLKLPTHLTWRPASAS